MLSTFRFWFAAVAVLAAADSLAQASADARDIFGVYMSGRAETPCGRATEFARNDQCPVKPHAVEAKFAADADLQSDPGLRCEPARLVRLFTWFPRPVEIVRGYERIVFRYENMGVIRTIYMDDTPPPPADWKSIHGFSKGRWEGDTLVVETSNLMENYWVLPTSDETRTIERYRWNDSRTQLLLDVEVIDPKYYDHPFRLQPARFNPTPDGYIGDYDCVPQTESLFFGDDIDAFFGD